MITKSRTKISENGQLYLFWGWLSFFLSIAHYVLHIHFKVSWAPMVWLGTIIGFAYQIYFLKIVLRQTLFFHNKAKKVKFLVPDEAFFEGILVPMTKKK